MTKQIQSAQEAEDRANAFLNGLQQNAKLNSENISSEDPEQ